MSPAAVSSILFLWCPALGMALRGPRQEPGSRLFLDLVLGMVALYCLVLSGLALDILALGLLCTLPVLLFYVRATLASLPGRTLTHFLLLCLLAAPVAMGMLWRPLEAWDARSIWFFHAKIIFYANRLANDSGFVDMLGNGHFLVDYPKLLPSVSALAATLGGGWNEFLPKTSLTLVLAAALAGLAEVRVLTLSAKCLLLGFVFSLHAPYLVGGYNDHWVAIFSCLGLLFALQVKRDRGDLASGTSLQALCACILLVPMFKNEGKPAALCLILAAAAAELRPRDPAGLLKGRGVLLPAACLLALAAWEARKLAMGLYSTIDLFSAESFARLAERLQPDLLSVLFDFLLLKSGILALALLTLAAFIFRRRIDRIVPAPEEEPGGLTRLFLVPTVFGLAYLAIVALVHLLNPYYVSGVPEMAYYLGTNSERVVMPAQFALALPVLALWSRIAGRMRRCRSEGPSVRETSSERGLSHL